MAPIVFEAAEQAGTTVGTVTLVGHGRFGDRKEALEYVAGASPLGPDLTHTALAGAMTWPPAVRQRGDGRRRPAWSTASSWRSAASRRP